MPRESGSWDGPAVSGWVAAEFQPHRAAVGMVEVVEDFKCLLPGLLCPLVLRTFMVHVAEMVEGDGFAVTVADLAEQIQGLLVGIGGDGVVAEMVVGVGDCVPGCGLAVPVVVPCRSGSAWWACSRACRYWPSRASSQAARLRVKASPT